MWPVLLAVSARAGVPVALPEGESPSLWAGTLALGQLEWASPASGAPVEIREISGRWLVSVRDEGAVRTAQVAAPQTPEAREDLVWLVVSLLTPVEPAPEPEPIPEPAPVRLAAAPSPAPVPRSPAPQPASTARSPAQPRPAPRGPPDDGWEPEGWASLPPIPPPPAPPAPRAPPAAPEEKHRAPIVKIPPPPEQPPPLWARVILEAGLRSGMPAQGTLSVCGGAGSSSISAGGGFGLSSRTPLPEVGPGRSYGALPLFGALLFTPRYGLLGVHGGFELRRFVDGNKTLQIGAMPFVRAEAAASVYLGRHLHLEPGLAYRLDLGVTEIELDSVRVRQIPAQSWQGALAVRIR